MKKIMMSLLAVAWLSVPAPAQSNGRNGDPVNIDDPHNMDCPAATCTDHSHDQAYSAQWGQNGQKLATRNQRASSKSDNGLGVCPAHSCTDHSYDEAYSARWAEKAQSPRSSVVRVSASPNVRTWGGMRDRQYTLKDFTVRERYPANMNAPYQGADAPSYDGAARNMYRNMRANNESEPLPPNHGGR